jgi:diacylglycerol kinase family enzyme
VSPAAAPVTVAAARQPSLAPRILAWASLAATAVLVVAVVAFVIGNVVYIVAGLAGLLIAVAGCWWVVAAGMPRRALGVMEVLLGSALLVFAVVEAGGNLAHRILGSLLVVLLVVAAVVTGRLALLDATRERVGRHFRQGVPPHHPVLICNPASGGGKVGRYDIPGEAAALGVETVLLGHESDLAGLAYEAIDRGADCLGMAGGDGSQALVASIATASDVPFLCVSAGTRNHFALDLGLDRRDPRAGLGAFRDAVERRVDYGMVNDRLFVNNVSLGVYASIVEDPAYRDAKLETSRTLLPDLLGRQGEPFDLQFTTPDGTEVDGAFLLMVSNNPYVLGPSLDLSQRRRLDSGRLGVFAVSARSGAAAADAVAHALLGNEAGSGHVYRFTTDELEVRSRSGAVAAGVDGESVDLPTPLRFRIQPLGLRVLVPRGNEEAAVHREIRGVGVGHLLAVARGGPPSGRA